jgi:hypothetical protein
MSGTLTVKTIDAGADGIFGTPDDVSIMDYAPGSVAYFLAGDAPEGTTFQFSLQVLEPGADGLIGTDDDLLVTAEDPLGQPTTWEVTDGVWWSVHSGADGMANTADDRYAGDLDFTRNGQVLTSWTVDPNGYYLDTTLQLTATADNDGNGTFGDAGDEVATTLFTDATATGNRLKSHDVWEPTTDTYVNGNAQGYTEGESASFAVKVEVSSRADQTAIANAGKLTLEFDINLDLRSLSAPGTYAFSNLGNFDDSYLPPIPNNEVSADYSYDSIEIFNVLTGGSVAVLDDDDGNTDIDITDVTYLGVVRSNNIDYLSYKVTYDVYDLGDYYFLYGGVLATSGDTVPVFGGGTTTATLGAGSVQGTFQARVGDGSGGDKTVNFNGADIAIAPISITVDKDILCDTHVFETGDNPQLLVGGSIDYKFTVSNTSTVTIAYTLTDDVYELNGLAGDTDLLLAGYQGTLAGGASAVITLEDQTVLADSHPDTATVDATYTSGGQTRTATATDDNGYTGVTASLEVTKALECGEGGEILAGRDITWLYTVTNTGTAALTNVTIVDDMGTADTGDDVIVATGVSLAAGASYDASLDGTSQAGGYTNTATATGSYTDACGYVANPIDTDTSSYTGVTASLEVTKALECGEGGEILAGRDITWLYTVTNTGTAALTNVTIVDDMGTADTGDDVIVATGISLAAGASYDASLDGTSQAGGYTNTAMASGSYTDACGYVANPIDTDTSSYTGVTASLMIDKVTIANGQEGDGIVAISGEDVTWRYTVTNTGDVALSDLSVTDDQGVVPLYQTGDDGNGLLDVGESWVYEATGTAIPGVPGGMASYENIGTATATYTDACDNAATATDDDASSYVVLNTGYVTNSSLCTFGDTFNLLFTPSFNDGMGLYKLSDSNPGQFYYNVFTSGDDPVTLNIPYPFVTQGAMPVHIYSSVEVEEHDGEICFVPGEEIDARGLTFTIGDYTDTNGDGEIGFGDHYTVTVDGLPDEDFLYINIHLDFGLEKTKPWARSGENALDTDGLPYDVDILENTLFNFSSSVLGSEDGISNDNIFKNIKGLGGTMRVENETESFGLAGQKLIFTDTKNKVVGQATTDEDGWYFGTSSAPSKLTTYRVWWDQDGDGKVVGEDTYVTTEMGGKIKFGEADFHFADAHTEANGMVSDYLFA